MSCISVNATPADSSACVHAPARARIQTRPRTHARKCTHPPHTHARTRSPSDIAARQPLSCVRLGHCVRCRCRGPHAGGGFAAHAARLKLQAELLHGEAKKLLRRRELLEARALLGRADEAFRCDHPAQHAAAAQ